MKPALGGLYRTFQFYFLCFSVAFFISFTSPALVFVWSCFMISLSLFWPSILFVYCFPDFVDVSICTLVACWAFLQQLFWICCQEFIALHFFGFGKIIVFLCCVTFPWFSMFFIMPRLSVFTFQETITSSSLYWLTLGEKYPHQSVWLGILRLWEQTFPMDEPAPHFLFHFGREFLRLYPFSQSCKARQRDEDPSLFPLKCSILGAFLQPQSQASFLHVLTSCL